MPLSVESICRKVIVVKGIVQGVGFRPFIYSLANKYELSGFVYNDGSGVIIEIEGHENNIEKFERNLSLKKPPLSRIDSIEYNKIDLKHDTFFKIIDSRQSNVLTMLSPDISMCDACKKELFDKSDRRYLYPFINCTHCGPRFSIVNQLPYDRKHTSMKNFPMCKKCKEEYEDPINRRYHAQPIACFKCGPKISIKNLSHSCKVNEKDIIATIVKCIKKGETVAIKGLGGFHLVCDATNEDAIMRLRKNKFRPTKPLAVMFKDIKSIESVCEINADEKEIITSMQRPIVLVKKKSRSRKLAPSLAPNIDTLGVFLPYTPIHEMILKELKTPIVATSANISGEPIIREGKAILAQLPLVTQTILDHDREVVNACDDSVVCVVKGQKIMMRLSRGYAPLSFQAKQKNAKKILALGANQKSSITLAFDKNVICSPYIGDLNSLGTIEYFERTIKTFCDFYNFTPDIVVCDKHPNYESSQWARKYVAKHEGAELIELQHHYAHALSVMAEYHLEEECLAFCFDGTGYGDDGLLWGCEVLLATQKKYTRIAHLGEFSLLGGEKAIKEPKRVALSLLFECYGIEGISSLENNLLEAFTKEELHTLFLMKKKKIISPATTSLGRMFDAVYALSGYHEPLSFEGESGMILESFARKYPSQESYQFDIQDKVIGYKTLIDAILKEKNKKLVASKFINAISNMMLQFALQYPQKKVLLSGGVFQNRVLLEKVIILFQKHNIEYYIGHNTPINDGGISLGQAYYAMQKDNIYGK